MRCCDQFIPIGPEVLFKEEKFVRERRQREYDSSEEESGPPISYNYMSED